MNAKHTWTWALVAAMLFAFIFFFERHLRQPAPGPEPILPNFKAAAVSSVQVYPAGQFEIRAERVPAGGTKWVLTRPISYPAQATRIEALLTALEHLTPAAPPLTARELRHRPKVEAEYGIENPQASLVIQQDNYSRQVLLGALTAPGDQVFLRVVGVEAIYVVDAGLLKLIPRATNDWRDTALVDLQPLVFDRLLITNAANVIEFQREATNNLWRLTRPLQVRADNVRIAEALQKLQMLHVTQFISDDPRADLESFGLQPAALELAFANGTNHVARLLFGKSPTNDASQLFARRDGLASVVIVGGEPLGPWRSPPDFFRDRRLVSLPQTIGDVEVRGEDTFILQPQSSNGWRMASQTFPVDAALADDLVATLAGMEIAQFVQGALTEPDLRKYGLAPPVRQFILKMPATAGAASNTVFAHLSFGLAKDDKVFATRAGEDWVYAVKLADFQRLPSASWQLRDRRIWNFTENDVNRLVVRQAGKTREILRLGTNSWTLAPGSQGMINSFAIEETAHRFGELAATLWVERAVKDRARYGISTNSLALTFELKRGERFTIEFGGVAPSQYPYAAVTLDQETWVFEFPRALYQLVSAYLTIPAGTP
jgi:hypothetical protein